MGVEPPRTGVRGCLTNPVTGWPRGGSPPIRGGSLRVDGVRSLVNLEKQTKTMNVRTRDGHGDGARDYGAPSPCAVKELLVVSQDSQMNFCSSRTVCPSRTVCL
jgi:hypothetical protein